MAVTPDLPDSLLESAIIHRRQTLRQVTLPIVGGIALLALVLLVALLTPRLLPFPEQVSMVADVFMVLCMLIPLLLCMMPLYLLLAVGAAGVGAFHRGSARQLRRVNRFSRNVTDRTIRATETIDQKTIDLRVRLTGIENVLDRPFTKSDSEQNDGDHTNDTTGTT